MHVIQNNARYFYFIPLIFAYVQMSFYKLCTVTETDTKAQTQSQKADNHNLFFNSTDIWFQLTSVLQWTTISIDIKNTIWQDDGVCENKSEAGQRC
jgi:hypothetical protein